MTDGNEVEGMAEVAAWVGLEPIDLAIHGISILSFINGESGEREFSWVVHGQPAIDETLGLLHIATHALIHAVED